LAAAEKERRDFGHAALFQVNAIFLFAGPFGKPNQAG